MDKVVITLPVPEKLLEPFREKSDIWIWSEPPITKAQLAAWITDATGLLCSLAVPIDRSLIMQAKALKVISTVSVGVDHIDVAAATERSLPVGHTPGVLVDSAADLTLALMLAVTRRLPEADRWIRRNKWKDGWQSDLFLGTDLSKARVGVVGLGPIGRAVIRRLQGFGCKVVCWNRTPRVIDDTEMVDLETLFATSDIVTLHTALTEETLNLVSRERLAKMSDNAVLINTGRGGLVDEEALIDELASGRLRAGLDVFENEPLLENHRLMGFDNVVLLPHVGSATESTRMAMMARAVENLRAGLAGEQVAHCANAEIYPPVR